MFFMLFAASSSLEQSRRDTICLPLPLPYLQKYLVPDGNQCRMAPWAGRCMGAWFHRWFFSWELIRKLRMSSTAIQQGVLGFFLNGKFCYLSFCCGLINKMTQFYCGCVIVIGAKGVTAFWDLDLLHRWFILSVLSIPAYLMLIPTP